MSYSLPAAMAARLQFPDRPVLCTIGDGGFGMTCGEIETCVRERLHFVTVVYNDSSLSLIHASQQRNRGHADVRRRSWVRGLRRSVSPGWARGRGGCGRWRNWTRRCAKG